MTKTLASRQCPVHSLKIKLSALISIAIESSIDALVPWPNALTDMHELLTSGLTPVLDTTNALTDTDELLTNCLMPLTIFIESSNE